MKTYLIEEILKQEGFVKKDSSNLRNDLELYKKKFDNYGGISLFLSHPNKINPINPFSYPYFLIDEFMSVFLKDEKAKERIDNKFSEINNDKVTFVQAKLSLYDNTNLKNQNLPQHLGMIIKKSAEKKEYFGKINSYDLANDNWADPSVCGTTKKYDQIIPLLKTLETIYENIKK